MDVRGALTAVREYGALGMLDPSRVMIRGGGLTVLSALATAPDAFLARTSIAGVSDLLALQSKLPKIESRHLRRRDSRRGPGAVVEPVPHFSRWEDSGTTPGKWPYGVLEMII